MFYFIKKYLKGNRLKEHNTSLSIGILGIGAIGSALSYYLLQNQKLQINFYNRSPRTAIHIIKHNIQHKIPINCKTTIANHQNLDWLLICLKEHHFAAAESFLKNAISSKTKIAVIRNGVHLKEPLLLFSKEENILECIIDCPCQPQKNGAYHMLRTPRINTTKNLLAEQFSQLFPKEEIVIQQVEDFKTATWKKLCESAALGGLLATQRDTCRIFKNPEMVSTYKKLLQEGIEIAKADGANIENNFAALMLEKLFTYPPHKGSSMLTDRLLGRKIELGAKNGVIVRLGNSFGIPTPEHQKICLQLRN